MPPPRPLNLLVVGEDEELRDVIAHAFESEGAIGSVRSVDATRASITSIPEPDVVLVDAGPPAPHMTVAAWHTGRKEPLTLVIAADWSEETRELGRAVGAVAYVKKDAGVASLTPLVLALASLAAGNVPV
jgi:DNA-binding response OmpR family regulator